MIFVLHQFTTTPRNVERVRDDVIDVAANADAPDNCVVFSFVELLMPQITDQERLLRENKLAFVSKGPLDGMWRCQYLKCPKCGYYVMKGRGFDECPCGTISIDSDYLRVLIESSPESEIECFNAVRRATSRSH